MGRLSSTTRQRWPQSCWIFLQHTMFHPLSNSRSVCLPNHYSFFFFYGGKRSASPIQNSDTCMKNQRQTVEKLKNKHFRIYNRAPPSFTTSRPGGRGEKVCTSPPKLCLFILHTTTSDTYCVNNQVQHHECLQRESVWTYAPLSHNLLCLAPRYDGSLFTPLLSTFGWHVVSLFTAKWTF